MLDLTEKQIELLIAMLPPNRTHLNSNGVWVNHRKRFNHSDLTILRTANLVRKDKESLREDIYKLTDQGMKRAGQELDR